MEKFVSVSVELHMKMGSVSTFRKNIKIQCEVKAVYPQPLFLEGVGKGYIHLDISLKRYFLKNFRKPSVVIVYNLDTRRNLIFTDNKQSFIHD